MGFRQTHRRLKFFALAGLFFCLSASAQDAAPEEQVERSPVTVQAFDPKGHLLHSGLGFLYDESTLICSYKNIRGASVVKFQANGESGYANRLISYNPQFDVAVLKAEEELQAEPLGSSDMLAPGDSVYFFCKENRAWKWERAAVKGFTDSGNGYELIRVQPSSGTEKSLSEQPSALFNSAGKVVGWLNDASTALPLQAIAQLLVDKESSVPLSEINDATRICNIEADDTAAGLKKMESTEMQTFEGSKSFPFQIDFPRDWKSFKSVSSARYVLRAMRPAAGVCIELRVIPEKIDDLPIAIEKSETVLNSGMTRSQLEPFSGENFSGFKADYLEVDSRSGQALTAFYSMAHRNFYLLAVRYPRKNQEEVQSLVDQIVASLHL